MAVDRGDLVFAAVVFLEGSEPPSGGRRAPVHIGQGAVARVTDALSSLRANIIMSSYSNSGLIVVPCVSRLRAACRFSLVRLRAA